MVPRRAAFRVSLLAALWALCLATGHAGAAPHRPLSSADAKKVSRLHFEKAEQAYDLGKFEEALRGYEAAYEALALTPFVFNIAQCHRNVGNHERALFFYQRYLALEPDPPNRKIVEDLIAEEQKRLGEQEQAAAAKRSAAEREHLRASTPPREGDLLSQPTAAADSPHDPAFYRRPWFWGAAGSVIVAGIAASLLITRDGPMPKGTIGTINAQGPMK